MAYASQPIFAGVLKFMEATFSLLEKQVPPPKKKAWRNGYVFRYEEKSIQQALILKLARVVSGLHAIDLLLLHGFVQEQACLQRILDEITEDISFLAIALTNDKVTDRHKAYLAAFFAEEFADPTNPMARPTRPPFPPRKKIRAYVFRILMAGRNTSAANDVGEIVGSVYSGYVHAAAPQILDMYGGIPQRFHLKGMLGTQRVQEHEYDAWNYFYRALCSFGAVAKAFGDAAILSSTYALMCQFTEASGEPTRFR